MSGPYEVLSGEPHSRGWSQLVLTVVVTSRVSDDGPDRDLRCPVRVCEMNVLLTSKQMGSARSLCKPLNKHS